jgi:hypothetical protein
MDLRDRVFAHAELYNAAVRSGDYSAFVETFAEDAVMRFEAIPVGPFRGREAIAEAYATRPPTDTLTVRSVSEVDEDTARVTLDYDGGGSGWMVVRWRDFEVTELTIGFD